MHTPVPAPTVTIATASSGDDLYAGTSLNLTCSYELDAAVDTADVAVTTEWTVVGYPLPEIYVMIYDGGIAGTVVNIRPLSTSSSGVYVCSVVANSSSPFITGASNNSSQNINVEGTYVCV